jgi:hypothetical protein
MSRIRRADFTVVGGWVWYSSDDVPGEPLMPISCSA